MRNLWFLMLYASDLARHHGSFDALLEKDLDGLPDLVARLLSSEVARRLRRNLSRGYRHREAILTRVRGRIDTFMTATRRLLDRGEVACRFDELTIDIPRNRYVRAALERLALLANSSDVAHQCRSLAGDLAKAGVIGLRPSRAELARESIGRNDAKDRFMLVLAGLAFDLRLPTEEAGAASFTNPDRDEIWIRRLFEKAITGFYKAELDQQHWRVRPGQILEWQKTTASTGIEAILPSMKTDIILEQSDGRLIVIDTKFTSLVCEGWHRDESLRSAYLYQIYAYLRSQERPQDPESPWNRAEGILLHPSIAKEFDESVSIQGHSIRFVTVNLADRPKAIRDTLRKIVYGTS